MSCDRIMAFQMGLTPAFRTCAARGLAGPGCVVDRIAPLKRGAKDRIE
jgi:hypothetical protein